jgi:hypothetical protein
LFLLLFVMPGSSDDGALLGMERVRRKNWGGSVLRS